MSQLPQPVVRATEQAIEELIAALTDVADKIVKADPKMGLARSMYITCCVAQTLAVLSGTQIVNASAPAIHNDLARIKQMIHKHVETLHGQITGTPIVPRSIN